MTDSDRYALLSEPDRAILRLLIRTSSIKALAPIVGLSPDALEKRLSRMRARTGLRRSIDLAHLVARVENDMSGLQDTGEPDLDPAPVLVAKPRWPAELIPFGTSGRPWNAHGLGWRLAWPLVAMLLIALATGALLGGLSTLSMALRPI